MTVANEAPQNVAVTTPGEREIRTERVFNAPRDRVWRAYTEPEQVARWWGRGNRLVVERMDVQRGGHWRFVEHSPEGVHGFEGRYREVAPPERLVQTFEWDGMPGYVAVETTSFEVVDEGHTRVVTVTQFHTAEERDGMLSSGMALGLNQSYAVLDGLLAAPEGPLSGAAPADRAAGSAAEEEIRTEFASWFAAASSRDLDAAMSRIAGDCVSYEHIAPLQYDGIDAIREVCRNGFDALKGELRVDLPGLKVIVRDDIAVTWGLNHMQAQEPGKERFESWSRGTRVMQKIGGKWKMIHQHLSYPLDPQTGQARTDLKPDSLPG